MLSSAFLELPSHLGMYLTACSKKLIVVYSMFFLNKFFSAHVIRLWKEVHLLGFKIDGPTVGLSGCIIPTFIQMQLYDNIDQKS